MANPHTAAAKVSVFKRVGRATFEGNVRTIKNKYKIPGAAGTCNAKPTEEADPVFNLALEEQLANDFAFLAICKSGPDAVRAATVQALSQPDRLNITLASNEGVPKIVMSTFMAMSTSLSDCAVGDIARQKCEELLLDRVIRMNIDKLYGRLRSRKCKVTTRLQLGQNKASQPWLVDRIREWRCGAEVPQSKMSALKACIATLREHLVSFETLPRHEDIYALKVLIATTCAVHEEFADFLSKLRDFNCPHNNAGSRQLHEIGQIARYVGVCRTLTKLARSRPSLFSNIVIASVPAYKKCKGVVQPQLNLHVHGEVQLVAHFELNVNIPRPRVIGSSKGACFLCNSFLRAYGLYRVTSTHGVFYTQWTVPDLGTFSSASRERISKALVLVNKDVLSAQNALRSKSTSGMVFTVQSVIDVGKQLWSPIATSVGSLARTASVANDFDATIKADGERKIAALTPPHAIVEESMEPTEHSTTLPDSACLNVDGQTCSDSGSLPGHEIADSPYNHDKTPILSLSHDPSPQIVTVDRPLRVMATSHKLELFFELGPRGIGSRDRDAGGEATATVSVITDTAHFKLDRAIDVCRLPFTEPGEIISRQNGEADALTFQLCNAQSQPIEIECRLR